VPDAKTPSKLEVGFALPGTSRPLGAGPYWVVWVSDDYSLGIVTGGPPTVPAAGGCAVSAPGSTNVNASGFWLFSRTSVDPAGEALLRERAAELGLDLSQLVEVEQEGCAYPE
jgi:lipocalin